MTARPEPDRRPSTSPSVRTTLASSLREFRSVKGWLVAIAICSALSAVVEVVVAMSIAALGSAMLSPDAAVAIPLVGSLGEGALAYGAIGAVVCLGVLSALLGYLDVAGRQAYEVRSRRELLLGYMDAEWAAQSQIEPSEVAQTMWNHLGTAKSAYSQANVLVAAAVSFVIMLVGGFVASAWAVVGILVTTAVLAVLLRPLMVLAHRSSRDAQEAARRFAQQVWELTGNRVETRVLGVEAAYRDRVEHSIDEVSKQNARAQHAQVQMSTTYRSVVYLIAVLGLASILMLDVGNPEGYAAAILLLYRGVGYGRSVQSSYQALLAAMPAFDELEHSRTEFERHAPPERESTFVAPVQRLEFREVEFAYPNGHRALSSVSFELQRGEAVGIVGPSGAGKSTIAQLLLGLRDPTAGTVLLNGVDLAEIARDQFYGRVALVAQDPRCLIGTVWDNVRFLRPDISDDDVRWALESAGVLQEFESLPQGLDTVISVTKPSGGQVQRLAIARALAGRPDLLLLDEPTSALDAISEDVVRQTLDSLSGETMVIVIAHRLSTLRSCDRILVMNQGRVEAFGSSAEVMENSSFFAEATRLAQLA